MCATRAADPATIRCRSGPGSALRRGPGARIAGRRRARRVYRGEHRLITHYLGRDGSHLASRRHRGRERLHHLCHCRGRAHPRIGPLSGLHEQPARSRHRLQSRPARLRVGERVLRRLRRHDQRHRVDQKRPLLERRRARRARGDHGRRRDRHDSGDDTQRLDLRAHGRSDGEPNPGRARRDYRHRAGRAVRIRRARWQPDAVHLPRCGGIRFDLRKPAVSDSDASSSDDGRWRRRDHAQLLRRSHWDADARPDQAGGGGDP